MRPMISNTPYYKLNIPEMSGGINLRDGISSINDNQLSEGKNVWFKDGLLRTRPASVDKNAEYTEQPRMLYQKAQIVNNEVYEDGERLIAFRVDAEKSGDRSTRIAHSKINRDGISSLVRSFGSENTNCFVTSKDGFTYTFVDGFDYSMDDGTTPADCEFEVYCGSNRMTANDMYVPTIATDCVVTGRVSYKAATEEYFYNGAVGFSGHSKEGYNLLSPYYKFIYSTVNKDLISAEDVGQIDKVPMSYKLPSCPFIQDPVGCEGRKVVAKITDKAGNVRTHEAVIGSNGIATETKPVGDGLGMVVGHWGVNFFRDGILATASLSDYVENNLEIILPSPNGYKGYEKVTKMTQSAWFGGEASGIAGGTRLFLCGSIREGDENLVIWSDLNDPLYFPENNYARIGNPKIKTTALGKQGDKLVIFKESETFYTKYVETANITGSDIESQTVYDVTGVTAMFPMVDLNSNIGCDCPDTVQLCNNRLVWATSTGKVYELVSDNQYNENNVCEVSSMIERMLAKETNLKMSSAADWDGKYLLAVDNRIYVMDYSSYGFSNIYSYSKKEDASKYIPWWYWEFDKNIQRIYSFEDVCLMLRTETCGILESGYSFSCCIASTLKLDMVNDVVFKYDTQTGIHQDYVSDQVYIREEIIKPICTSVKTKFFNFGAPTVKKNIPKIELSLGANGGEPVRVDVITDKATEENELIIDDETSNNKLPNYFVNKLIRVGNKNAHRIGLKFECDGAFALESMSLQYKQLGGLK